MLTKLKGLFVRRLPWWVVLVVGTACVALGVWLTAEPFKSLTVLAALVAAGLIVTGVSELASAESSVRPWLSRLAGSVWIVVGVVAASWTGITIHALAIAVGIGLVVGGTAKMATALFGDGDERFILGISGLTNVVFGVLPLSWPDVTVLVLAVVFGVRTVLFGIGQMALGLRLRQAPSGLSDAGQPTEKQSRWPRPVRLIGAVVALALSLGGMAISVVIHRSQSRAPGAFYTAPSPLPDGPMGTIIRHEVIAGFTSGATTYRVLYKSTGYDGKPTAVSGMIIVPDSPAPVSGHKIVAYTHGTIGVATNCSPSLQGAAFAPIVEGLSQFVADGYVIAATDYQGLGTPGPHPYLIGKSEGENELDMVRAAHNLPEARAGTDFAVWGHSQGGQASLFTGQLAASYAAELHLVGVAAGAPVPNLIDLFAVNIKTIVGRVLIAMALQSWARVYHDANLDDIVTPAARPAVARIARYCLYQTQLLATVPSSLLLGITFTGDAPWTVEPWKTILADNTPGRTRIGVPILITQGAADPIVAPDVTTKFTKMLCTNGEQVDYRLYPGVQHVDAGFKAAPDVTKWIADRFAGQPASSTC